MASLNIAKGNTKKNCSNGSSSSELQQDIVKYSINEAYPLFFLICV